MIIFCAVVYVLCAIGIYPFIEASDIDKKLTTGELLVVIIFWPLVLVMSGVVGISYIFRGLVSYIHSNHMKK